MTNEQKNWKPKTRTETISAKANYLEDIIYTLQNRLLLEAGGATSDDRVSDPEQR